jgi:hypothetical protein
LWDRGLGQNVVEASNDSTFATGTVLLDTLTFQPYISQYLYNRRAVSPGAAYRYYRVRSPVGVGDLAEFRVIGTPINPFPDDPTKAQPLPPSISPWGGVYLSGTPSITLATTTTTASIRYTINGATPTCSSTLYSAPFALTVGTATLIKAVACESNFATSASEISTAHFRNYAWAPGDSWYDIVTGDKIEGFSGSLLRVSGRYYMTGQWNLMGNIGANGYAAKSPGIWMYSSADAYNWQLESEILDNGGWDFGPTREKIIFNTATNKYVLWAHCGNADLSVNRACIATASTITGPWTWVNTSLDPDGQGYKDCTLFRESDGTAYTAYTDSSQNIIRISKLTSDYLGVTGDSVIACNSCNTTTSGFGGSESPILFRRGNVYFLILGSSTFYTPHMDTNPEYITATSPLGTWSSSAIPLHASNPTSTDFNGQPAFVFHVPGKVDAWLYVADWWSHATEPSPGSTHQFLPLTFADATHVRVSEPSTWDLSLWSTQTTTMIVTPSTLTYACVSNRTTPAEQTVAVSDDQATLDDWTASKSNTWLTPTPTTGMAAATITAAVSCLGLLPGTHTDTLTVSSNTIGVENSPQMVGITLNVAPAISVFLVSGTFKGSVKIH